MVSDPGELSALHARIEAALKKLPGVVGVGFGLKEVDGRTTDQIAFRVYVRAKRPEQSLSPSEVIPKEIEGYPTDVVVLGEVEPLHCQDIEQHDPLIGGISITNFKGGAAASAGTLGFFATVNGAAEPKNVVLVSNNHVLADNGGAKDDRVFQPGFVPQPDGSIPMNATPDKQNPIGQIDNIGQQGPYNFTYPGDAADSFYLDCATARLDISISSWCHCNCGVSYKNEIRGLNIGGNSKIADIARVSLASWTAADAAGRTVYKVGRTTSRTKGKIVDPIGMSPGGGRQIVIEPLEPDCNNVMQFADHGDSGAAIVDRNNKVIGLLYARNGNDQTKAWACHIHPVLDYLKITAITTAHPPVPPAGQARLDAFGVFDDEADPAFPLRQRLLATPEGAELHALVTRHRQEVVDLVNRCRPVTVAWHRSRGPQFINRIIANLRGQVDLVPREIDGVGRLDLLRRMAEVLHANGSDALRAAIDAHADAILARAEQIDDLRELPDLLQPEPVRPEEKAYDGTG